jgi:hypothetical protein
MTQPIKIIVTAETAQAAAALQQFVTQSGGALQQLATKGAEAGAGLAITREGVRALTDPLRGLNYALMLMGGSFPEFTRGILLATAGMMGTRAISMSLGLSLSTLLPVVGLVAAAVGGGLWVWHEYKSAEEEAIQANNDMAESLQRFPALLKTIHDAAQGGILPKETADQMNQALAGASTTPVSKPGKNWLDKAMDWAGGVGKGANLPQSTFAQVASESGVQPGEDMAAENFKRAQAAYDASLPGVQAKINEQLAQLGILLEKTDVKTGNKTYEKNPELEDLESVDALQKKITLDNLAGVEKAREAARQKHDEEMDELNQRLQLAQKGRQDLETKLGQAGTTGVKSAITAEIANVDTAIGRLNALKSETDAALPTKLAAIDSKAQEEAAKAQVESENKIREQGLKDFAETNKQIDAQITLQADRSGKKREDLWQQEYKQRIVAATEALYSGQIDEKTYADAVDQAQIKMYDGQKRYNAELEKELQIKMEIARGEAEVKLKRIETDRSLSPLQKARQSVGPLQSMLGANEAYLSAQNAIVANPATSDQARITALDKINSSMEKQVDLQNKLADAQNKGSFVANVQQWAEGLQRVNNFGQNAANIFTGALTTGINSVSSNLTKVIEGTETWKQGLLNIEEALVSNVLEAIIKVVAELLVEEAVLVVVDALKGVAMFDDGGYTGAGDPRKAAGIVHGGEYVFSAPAVQRIGVSNLEQIHHGYADGGLVGGGGSGSGAPMQHNTSIYAFTDPRQMADHLERNPDHEAWVVDVMGKNIHKFR